MAPERTPSGGKGPRWTSRSIGTRVQHHVFYFLIKVGGRRSAYLLLSCVALYYVLCRPSIRAKATPYLSRRFRKRGFLSRLMDRYRIFVALGQVLIDRAIIGILGEKWIEVSFPDRETLLHLVAEGRGVILMTAHVGCWQTAMASLTLMDVPVHLVLRREEGDIAMHYYEHAGTKPPFGIIDPGSAMGGVIEMMQALKRGEIVCVMGDRHLGSRRGAVPVNFLGDQALFPFSAFKIASATGAPVVVLFSHKSRPAHTKLRIYRVIRVKPGLGMSDKELPSYVSQFVSALESYTQEHPYQFFNFFNMWKNDVQSSEDKEGNTR